MMDEIKVEHRPIVAVNCKECGWVYIDDVTILDESISFNNHTNKEEVEYTFKCMYCNTRNISRKREMK